jgi:hypothetical protein
MLGFAIIVASLVSIVVLLPFVVGPGGSLASAQSLNSIPQLESVRKAIIARYIVDEKAFHEQEINKYMWQQRRMLLVNRYVDASRRLDLLRHLEKSGGAV